MQVNQLIDTNHSIFDRMVSLFLVMLMLISFIPEPNLIVSAEDNNGGFDLSLSWNSDSNNDNSTNPSENFVYNSDKNEERLITLKVKYSNKEVTNGYAPGQIIITVPGLKGAVRSGESYIPVGIAADEVSSINKIYDWSYSYTETTDTYTFINNKSIESKSTFEGSFEIMWKLPSRETIDEYSTEIQAELNATTIIGDDQEYYKTGSNSISYSQIRERDKYELSEEANYLYKDEVWANEDSPKPDNFDEYTWVSYNISSFDTYLARDVNGSERFDCYFLEGAIVQGAGLIKTNNTRNDFGDGKTYQCWSVTKDINDNTQNPCLQNIYVAYPKEYENQEVTNYVELRGTYFDEDQEETLAYTSITVNLSNYGFRDIPGDIYDVEKCSYGIHSLYIDNHCNQCSQYGAINSTHLSNGEGTYYSSLKLELNYKGDNADDDERYKIDYYDLEFVDDIMDISLKNGDFKQLSDDEYNFTSIYIPANTEIINKNNLPIKANTYDVKIYLRRASGTFPFQYLTDENYSTAEPYATTKIQSKGQEIIINDDDVVGVKIVVCGVQESFYTDKFRCYYKFHISDEELEEIITDGGQLINNMYFNLYRSYNGDYEWFNNDFTRNEYSSDREYQRDMQIYGHGLDREKATLHILEIPSEFKLEKVEIKQDKDTKNTFELNGSITSKFILGEGVDLSKFSMYTIIPSGLKLSEIYNTPENISDVLTFASSDGLSSAYIAEHTTIEIKENYKGSGRQYIAIHYDFSDNPITSETITVSNIPMYANKDDFDGIQSKSYTMYAGMLIDQQGKWYSTSVDNNTMDNNIWVDMDNDNDIVEVASFNSNSIQIYNAEATELEIVKFVKTSKTNGYVNPTSEEDVPMTYADGTYSYRLRAKVGETVNAKEFIFFDAIENYDGHEWQGEFVGVDYSFAEQIFGVEPIVYYSTEVETFPTMKDKNGKDVYNITPDTLKEGDWTTTKPDTVRSIAVYFGGEAIAQNKSIFYIDIIMRAPNATVATTNNYYNKITINDFAVGYDKVDNLGNLIEHENLPSNNVRVKFVPNMGKITLVKKDATDNTTITTGAEFQLYSMLGDNPEPNTDTLIGTYSTDTNGKIIINNLVYGNYYFKEITAPKGYKLSDELLQVELTDDKPDKSIEVTFRNERKDGQITIKKVSDRLSNLGLEGAKFSLYESNGTLVNENLTTDANGKLTISNLDWGSYYLQETQAPDGYIILNERFDFTINANNDAGRDLNIEIANEQKPAYATLIKYEALEDGTQTTNVLSGAVYELYKDDGSTTPIGTYITDKDGKIYAENLAFGNYYFKETIAPKGYELGENIEFTVSAEHTTTVLKVSAYDKRKTGRVYLQKLDDESEYVKGAVYGLFKGNQQIDSFTTGDEGDINIDGLYWGDYYLKEIKAPIGYELNTEEYSFSINCDTVSKRIIINATDNRLKGIVELTKYNEDETITLEGAVYTLYKNDGTIYRDNLTTRKDGKIIVKEIDWGSYYFLEKTAPNGYGLSDEKIRFSVNYLTAGKTQQVTATDPQVTGKITVTKKIKAEDIVFAHGNPTFTFKVTDNNGKYFYKTVSFSEDYIKDNTGNDGYVQMSVVFIELPVEQTYTVSEVETMRYTTDEITSQNGTVNSNKTVTFSLENEDTDYIANFINKKMTQSGTSHTSQLSNILNRERKLTSIVAIWNSDTYVTDLDDITTTDENINRSLLEVYAIYDDGNQIKLGNNDYTLTPNSFDDSNGSVDGSYTIKVSYTYNGITRTDSFDITIATGECVFTYVPNNDGNDTITITGYKGSSKVLNIPKVIKDGEKFYTVTAVGNGSDAISGISGCDTLILPEGLKTIGNNAFSGYSNLKDELNIPSTVTSIGDYAFYKCEGFTSLNFNENSQLETIGNAAFTNNAYSGMNLSGDLTIPNGVTSIGDSAFFGCTKLNGELTIPSSVKTIGNRAFGWCSNLTGGLDLSNVTSIGDRAFCCCSSLNGTLKLPTSTSYNAIKMNTFYQCGFTGTLEIPSNIEKIGYGAFYDCKGFTALVLNEGLKEICVAINGENFENCGSFQNCTGFSCDLTIPLSVQIIGDHAFDNANQDSGFAGHVLTIPKDNNLTYIGTWAFASCKFDSLLGDEWWNSSAVDLMQSRVWVAIDSNKTSNYTTNKAYYANGVGNCDGISTAIGNASLVQVGDDPFWGYQIPYGFFERS